MTRRQRSGRRYGGRDGRQHSTESSDTGNAVLVGYGIITLPRRARPTGHHPGWCRLDEHSASGIAASAPAIAPRPRRCPRHPRLPSLRSRPSGQAREDLAVIPRVTPTGLAGEITREGCGARQASQGTLFRNIETRLGQRPSEGEFP
jgi:hypothetical protein